MNAKTLRSFWFPALVFLSLLLYGTFYHITSSEFWPVTISKTWWTLSDFEYSQLQKPLFSLLLALFHLPSIDDLTHLYSVKILFSITGVLSLYYYIKNIALIAKVSLTPTKEAVLLIFLVLLSPILLQNFFRVRSDQLTFLFAMLSAYFALKNRMFLALLTTLSIPLISIKSVLLLLPLCFILWPYCSGYIKNVSVLRKLNFGLASAAVVIWIVSLNLPSFSYFVASYEDTYPSIYLKQYLQHEFLLLALSLFCSAVIIYKRIAGLLPLAFAALSAVLLILLAPQSYPYYIATLTPFVYAPLFALILQRLQTLSLTELWAGHRRFLGLLVFIILLQATVLMYFHQQGQLQWNHKNTEQLTYIKKASRLFKMHPRWTYLDGMGILPSPHFARCFVSPYDDESNASCWERLRSEPKPDVVIITQRLNFLGTEIFQEVGKNYFQVLPNFWVHKKHQSSISTEDIELTGLPLPILIFNF